MMVIRKSDKSNKASIELSQQQLHLTSLSAVATTGYCYHSFLHCYPPSLSLTHSHLHPSLSLPLSPSLFITHSSSPPSPPSLSLTLILPHSPPLHQVNEESGLVYIFQEWACGGSVAHLLKQFGPFQIKTIKNYTKQILLGLNYLHDNGIIHR